MYDTTIYEYDDTITTYSKVKKTFDGLELLENTMSVLEGILDGTDRDRDAVYTLHDKEMIFTFKNILFYPVNYYLIGDILDITSQRVIMASTGKVYFVKYRFGLKRTVRVSVYTDGEQVPLPEYDRFFTCRDSDELFQQLSYLTDYYHSFFTIDTSQ